MQSFVVLLVILRVVDVGASVYAVVDILIGLLFAMLLVWLMCVFASSLWSLS